MPEASVSLDDKYTRRSGRVYLTGTQALVRLPMIQRERDLAAGLNTAGFVTGYRGSPLGAVDQQMWQARDFIKQHHVHFQPAVNEDLGATAVMGSQQGDISGDFRYDGVFAMWYGKGPGVDRSGDVFRHGNFAGTAKHGGVLLLAGDDHAPKSSTTAHQCEYAFMDAMIPVLNPAGVQEFLDFGLYGWALSRFSGCWVGMKCVTETVEASASVSVDPERVQIRLPDDFAMPEGGLNIRWDGAFTSGIAQQEERLHRDKLYAAQAFVRANGLDRCVIDSPKRRFGIVTAGKAYLDVRQALDDLGIDEATAAEIGLSVYKVGMPWPLEPHGIRAFAEGLEEILVVEEKRAVIENQVKEQLYNWSADKRPRIVGKFDKGPTEDDRDWLLPSYGELTPARVARAIAQLIGRHYESDSFKERLDWLEAKERHLAQVTTPISRLPYFCSGCPHNTSTKVPEGSRALAGIGCHYMAQWMDRDTTTFTQMGGEGVTWIGQAPFSKTEHVFVNLGDGTYYHSGILAIRAAVASGANLTYKILYNDAVAMTGGQPVDGPLDPAMITRQIASEGVKRIVVVSDEPEKYPIGTNWAAGVEIEHRDDLDRVQRDLRDVPGVTAIVYDQTCAAEKRRRRKRGTFPDPQRRAFINDAVCEGCGDCSVQSNCVSVVPLETEFGTKRAIDQSSCNKDFSCLKGFCPSFVTVEGGKPRKQAIAGPTGSSPQAVWPELPAPTLPGIAEAPYGILVTGVGGTGVVTIGALLGMAAHIEGKGVTVLDMAGLAQKGGPVTSHIRLAETPEDLHAVRLSAGSADLVLGCDLVVAASQEALGKMSAGKTTAIVNDQETVTGDFTRNSTAYSFPGDALKEVIVESVGAEGSDFISATRLATALLGDSIAANLFLTGYAWQKGLIPVSREAIEQAIDLNGVAVTFNKQAFLWGRRAAVDLEGVRKAAFPRGESPAATASAVKPQSLDELIARRVAFLTDYQDAAYAERYRALVARVREAESAKTPETSDLAEAVARYAFKLMAYKDEYEVARLYAAPEFMAKVKAQFEGDFKLKFQLAPPLLAKKNPDNGQLMKQEFGPWMMTAFRLMARLRGLRGTPFDIFGYTAERRAERRAVEDYFALIEELICSLAADNHGLAVELASLPDGIRGYGHVKEANQKRVAARQEELLAAWRTPGGAPLRQAAE